MPIMEVQVLEIVMPILIHGYIVDRCISARGTIVISCVLSGVCFNISQQYSACSVVKIINAW